MNLLAIRIPIPHEIFWPLLIILGVLTVISLAYLVRKEGWDGTKGMRPEDAERTRSAFQEQFRRELPIYGPLIVALLAFLAFAFIYR